MKGTQTIIKTNGEVISTEITKSPGFEAFQKIVGGNIELIGGFETYEGKPAGLALCNEEGKLKGLPINQKATRAWRDALGFDPGDILVGDVVIITGDDELLETL